MIHTALWIGAALFLAVLGFICLMWGTYAISEISWKIKHGCWIGCACDKCRARALSH